MEMYVACFVFSFPSVFSVRLLHLTIKLRFLFLFLCYGVFVVTFAQVIIMTERAAKNMAYQSGFAEFGKFEELLKLKGTDLIGLPLKVRVLCPLLTVDRRRNILREFVF